MKNPAAQKSKSRGIKILENPKTERKTKKVKSKNRRIEELENQNFEKKIKESTKNLKFKTLKIKISQN